MIQVGDQVRRKIALSKDNASPLEWIPVDAIVEWIHPEHRFYTLRVLLPGGRSYRTTDYFYPRAGGAI